MSEIPCHSCAERGSCPASPSGPKGAIAALVGEALGKDEEKEGRPSSGEPEPC